MYLQKCITDPADITLSRTAAFGTVQVEAPCQTLWTKGHYSIENRCARLRGGGFAYLASICQSRAKRTATAITQPLVALVPDTFHRAVQRMVRWRAEHPDTTGPDETTDAVLDRIVAAYHGAREVFADHAPQPVGAGR